MRFSYKIKKLLSGQGLASARKHTRRFFHRTRFPLETKRVIETIDGPKFQEIRQRYSLENPVGDWPKYLDLDRWIDINIRRIREVELDLSRPSAFSILAVAPDIFCISHSCSAIKELASIWRMSRCLEKSPGCLESVALSGEFTRLLVCPISASDSISSLRL